MNGLNYSTKGFFKVFVVLLLLPLGLNAQEFRQVAEQTKAVKLGTTPPVRDLLPRTPTDMRKLADYRSSKPEYVRNFTGRRYEPFSRPGTLPYGPDPLYNPLQQRDGGVAIFPEVNIEGMNRQLAGAGVPDPNGDVSDQYYVQVVNSTWIKVHDLAGNVIGAPFRANTIWQQVGFSSAGDPIILYDEMAGRWFLTEFPPSNRVLIAISETEDPFGAWTAYAFSTPRFPDYPKYGIWPDMYVLSTNESGSNIVFYTIRREDILEGKDVVDVQRFTIPRYPSPSWQTAQPVHWNASMDVAENVHPMIMRINDDGFGSTEVDKIEIYEILVNWEDEDSSLVRQIDIPLSPFDTDFCSVPGAGFSCIPQPNGQGIDGIPFIFMHNIHYRNFGSHSAIVGNFTVDVTGDKHAGIRWIELRKSDGEEWSLHQEGTVGANDGLHRFMGGIGIDRSGNIGLAYSVSGTAKHPSLRFTGRRASDPYGKMTVEEYEFATGSGSVNSARFGDYASMSVDKQDMFWYTGEYVPEEGQWATKIVGFRLTRDSVDIGPRELISPVNGPDLGVEPVTVVVMNQGFDDQSEFEIGLITANGDVVVEAVSIDPLRTDSTYVHTFAGPVDFSAFGPHSLTVFTSMPGDQNPLNDTCRYTVIHYTSFDASIPDVENLQQAICDTFTDLSFVLTNAGAVELTSAFVIWHINDEPADSVLWTGALARNEQALIDVTLAGLLPGINKVLVYSALPNGMEDQDPLNDTLMVDIYTTANGEWIELQLLTDNFPEETSWQLLDSNNTVLFQAGPYNLAVTEFIHQWCLDSTGCYQFVLLDNFGDGISAQGIEGDFQIINSQGVILASLVDPDFGFSDTTAFCISDVCALSVNVIVKHEDAPNSRGRISIIASGGVPPVMYSINGGQTFQFSPLYTGLSPGVYHIAVQDGRNCTYTQVVELFACAMQVMATVTDATGATHADGAVSIAVEGGIGPFGYSIDGGQTFQSDPLFTGLLPDTFQIAVIDSVGCKVSEEVIVGFTTSVRQVIYGSIIRVFPNPSDGHFMFEVEGLPSVIELSFDVVNEDGRRVLGGIASNYSGVVKGSFSLRNLPAGNYFLQFRHRQLGRMIHLVKI